MPLSGHPDVDAMVMQRNDKFTELSPSDVRIWIAKALLISRQVYKLSGKR